QPRYHGSAPRGSADGLRVFRGGAEPLLAKMHLLEPAPDVSGDRPANPEVVREPVRPDDAAAAGAADADDSSACNEFDPETAAVLPGGLGRLGGLGARLLRRRDLGTAQHGHEQEACHRATPTAVHSSRSRASE